MLDLSEAVLERLRLFGWHPERYIALAEVHNVLSPEGFVLFPIAVEFLTQLQGLTIKSDEHINPPPAPPKIVSRDKSMRLVTDTPKTATYRDMWINGVIDRFFAYPFEVNALHGLGTYSEIQRWIEANQIKLYPIGTYAQSCLYIGEDSLIYETDFGDILRVGNSLDQGLRYFFFPSSGIKKKIIPPDLY